MSYTYDQRKRPQGQQTREPERTAAPGPGMEALMSGRAAPSAAQKGRSFDLSAAMKAKMENAFGDLSAVKFYESAAVGEAGAEAIAQGSEIAFAPGKADFSTKAGQERLGHELSHVMSQRSGQVRGSGFLSNAALEARADREGAMAAAGQQIYTGPVTHALSGASPSPFAAGAMQARRATTEEKEKGAASLISAKQTWMTSDDTLKPDYQSIFDYEIAKAHQGVEDARKLEEELAFQRFAQEYQARDPNDSFNYSLDEGGETQGETKGETKGETESPETTEPEVGDDVLQAARRRGMINALTAKSRNRILNNWKEIMGRYDDSEVDDNGFTTDTLYVGQERKKELTQKEKLMKSSEFKKWIKQKVNYEDLSYEELEMKFNDLLAGKKKKWYQFWK